MRAAARERPPAAWQGRRRAIDHERVLTYLAAGLLGAALAGFTFPLDVLFPVSPPSGPFPAGDMAQHVVGQRYFIADAWRPHLLTVPSLGFPDGTNIGLTDSIPLLAIPLKLLAPWLPRGFEGIGLWYGIAWFLQPIAAVWCVRATGVTHWAPALCMAVVCASMPAWWNRFSHAALTGHFLLLIALGGYFILVRHPGLGRWRGAAVLLCVTVLVHPYLFLMNAAVLGAVPLTLLGRRERAAWTAAAGAAGAMAAALLLVWALGYTGTQGEGGFGRFAMNVFSPAWPAGSWLLAPTLAKIHGRDVSGWEGYNYLGAGLLFGGLAALAADPRHAWTAIRRHAGLVLALACLTMLALSNRIAFGYARVLEIYPAPSWLEAFRSSGRLFWPVGYALALAVVLGIARIRHRVARAGLLLAVAGLQFADVTGTRDAIARETHAAPRPWLVDAGTLRPLFAAHRSLVLLPPWNCLPPGPDRETQQSILLELLTLASETAIPVNTMYQARWRAPPDCDIARMAGEQPAPGEVRVLLPGVGRSLVPLIPDGARICRPVGDLTVCAAD